MTDKTDTWGMKVGFTLKCRAYAEDTPWLAIDWASGLPLPILYGGHLGLEFYEGTPLKKVREIAELLDEHIEYISYTGSVRPEFIDQPGRGAVVRRKRQDRT